MSRFYLFNVQQILPRMPVMEPLMMVAMKGVWNLGWMVARDRNITPSLAMASITWLKIDS